ncbi:uncharacterized protein LOC119078785 [Bradysia coprophila]|uniref:uncharacterized protein LOC119078785 n=1 Tax=Bradysia coprophila TaxID=38358 RepID=UPI00187DBC20|nr:uncharacterized protein LOC119078785 [Bradysia coprophila]
MIFGYFLITITCCAAIATSASVVEQQTCELNFVTELASIPNRIQQLEEKAAALELKLTKLETITTQLGAQTSQLEAKSVQVDAAIKDLTNLVNDIRAKAITNIRLGDLQTANVFGDLGYEDSYGFVLTSAANFNKDNYLDYVRRRKIEKFVNGKWVSI